MSNYLLLEEHLRTLKLPTMLREYQSVARECVPRNAGYEDYLQQLAERETVSRQTRANERRLKTAQFPTVKEIVDFQFSSVPQVNQRRILDLARGDFITQKANVIFLGPPGVGKTHLAIGIAREACRCGYETKFYTAARLAREYLEARDERRITRLENSLSRTDLIVIDELGYLPLDKVGAEHLFGFFSRCYEQCSIIITTNLPFADWPQTFGNDARLAGALIDRLTHRIHVVEVSGDSYRLKQSLNGIPRESAVERPSRTPGSMTVNVPNDEETMKPSDAAKESPDTAPSAPASGSSKSRRAAEKP